jgi:hypothetical protein
MQGAVAAGGSVVVKLRLLGLAALLAQAVAAAPGAAVELHDQAPGAGDNLRLYSVGAGVVSFSIDGAPAWSLGADSMVFARLEPGPHRVRATAADGQVAELGVSLNEDRAAVSKGRRWWCLMAGRREGRLTLVQPNVSQCKQIADAEPD